MGETKSKAKRRPSRNGKSRRGPGRPELDPRVRLSAALPVTRVTKEIGAKVRALARRRRITLTEQVRRLIVAGVSRH